MTTVFIGLGSNVGDRGGHLAAAETALVRLPSTQLTAFSPVYETAPVGPVAQGAFLNAVGQLETDLQPHPLLEHLRDIEHQAGRELAHSRIKWGPRPLDLDILFFGDGVLEEPGLSVPHPHLHERWFVLKPLSDLAPHFAHPVLGKTVTQMLQEWEQGQKENHPPGRIWTQTELR